MKGGPHASTSSAAGDPADRALDVIAEIRARARGRISNQKRDLSVGIGPVIRFAKSLGARHIVARLVTSTGTDRRRIWTELDSPPSEDALLHLPLEAGSAAQKVNLGSV